MKKIRWGIISTGRIAHSFAQDFKFVKNGELVGIASRTRESAELFADKYNILKAFGSYNELLSDSEIDAVYIATPHNLHYQNTLDAFETGKAVLCEKPLTINPEESINLSEAAKNKNCYLMEAMWTYFLPAIQKAQDWVDKGKIGSIKHIKADFGYPLPYDANRREYNYDMAGGCLLEMGIYPVALAWLFLKQDPQDFKVIARNAPNNVENDVSILFNYPDATATLATSFSCKLQNWAYIVGDKGYIAIPDFWRADQCHLYHLDDKIDSFYDERKSLGFNFETDAVNKDLLINRIESEVIPHSYSIKFQEHMAKIKDQFNF